MASSSSKMRIINSVGFSNYQDDMRRPCLISVNTKSFDILYFQNNSKIELWAPVLA